MPKRKLIHFKENETFSHFFQPTYPELLGGWSLKGKWSREFFGNDHPLILELGCGKGEYVVGLARKYPQNNYIGLDIKGARMWKGARTVQDEGLRNVAFIRTRIELIQYLFAEKEISEIWITFPDPHLRESRARKRLTHPAFLNRYRPLLKENHQIHLKTDNRHLYDFTLNTLHLNRYEIQQATPDLYALEGEEEVKGIRTFYEEMFSSKGFPITYIRFRMHLDRLAVWDANEQIEGDIVREEDIDS